MMKTSKSTDTPAPIVPSTQWKLQVPTYHPNAKQGEEEFTEPAVPILVCPADGLRIVLGTHDFLDYGKPDIQIERRKNGWMIFLHPVGGCDPSGYIYMLDDGRSFVQQERPTPTPPLVVMSRDENLEELDNGELPPGDALE